MKRTSIIATILAVVISMLTGCASSPLTQGGNPDMYDRTQAMQPGRVVKGTVIQVREVRVSSSKMANTIGAVVGGVTGYAIARGRTSNGAASTLAGLAGAAAGNAFAALVGESKANEIVVELPGNDIRVVVQEKGQQLPSTGQKVLLLVNGAQVRIVTSLM